MKFIFHLFILAIFAVLIYSFFFGALLFLNPIKVEYEHIKGERADIYTRDSIKMEPFYYEVETDIAQAEELTGLNFQNRPVIFVTQKSDEFARFLPWIKDSKNLLGSTVQIGNVIYINSEKIKKDGYKERDVLRHELIYNLITQNSIYLNSLVIDKDKWFAEGLATYFGGPKYLSDLQFLQVFPEKNPSFDDVSSNIFTHLPEDSQFNSKLYSLFVKYLIDTYGIETYRAFTKNYLDSPGNFRVIFFDTYDKKMIVVVDEFIKRYRNLSGTS